MATNEKNKSSLDDDTLKIKATIEKIRPFLQREGGDIELDSYDPKTGVVKVKMIGACNGCVFAGDEVSMGVETILTQEVPAITKVEMLPPDNLSSAPQAFPGLTGYFPNGIPVVDPVNDEEDDVDPLSLKAQIQEERERLAKKNTPQK